MSMAKRLMQMFAIACFMLVCCGLLKPASAQVPRSSYLEYVKRAAAEGWEAYPRVVAEWRANVKPSVLWGYDAPAQPIYLADILSFLYQETSDPLYARRAAQILADYGDLRNAYPKDYYKTRAEYAEGVPSMANFFFVPPYSRSYMRIRDSGVLDPTAKAKIESELAQSLDFIFHFPEWGSHNRAMLRAEGLYYGSLAIPGHAHAPRWRQMAEILASDNVDDWEAEDATIYHPVWLEALLSYADASGDDARIYRLPFLAYYAQYFKQLFTPAGTIADLGDADWNPSWFRYVAAFEKLAGEYRDPELKWIAGQLFENNTGTGQPTDVVAAASLAHAYLWANDTVGAQKPVALSQEALDDIVGKKVVFRNGWDSTSTYLLLNYRDEGEGAFATREFLRNTLSVEEEKTHHGHSDENDISILMSGGSVLLHDGGYRSGLPSGPYGAYRADYFHNRMVVRKNKRDRYQTLPEFIRNAGAHRPVRTQKIDFFSFHDVDMSRTRVYDDKIGYVWDRIITYVKPQDFFIVIDAVKAQEPDYYTFSNIWHTQHIHEQGPHYY
ncbi:MAG TPA: hypothetical protein VFG50_13860, partial [Rhodothermales bacterium]|nr:hypothetical protein [Rhodothermales bacterium]